MRWERAQPAHPGDPRALAGIVDWLPSLLASAGLAVAVAVFVVEMRSFREAVVGWAARDLKVRTTLAAANLQEPLATGDFRRIHAFGEDCAADGVRLTVFSGPGGVVFDSSGRRAGMEASIFDEQPCGDFRVRLGLPVSRVLAPYRRARYGFALAAFMGGSAVLLILLFTLRQRARLRELARERDAQRRLVEEMRKVEAFRRDFISDVSHEIKTPLTGIIGSVDLLVATDLPEAARRKLLGMVKAESERLNALAQGILSLARLERGDAAEIVSRAPVDLAALLAEVAEQLRTQAAAKGMSIEVEAPGEFLFDCDAQMVSSAVSNLVVNAIRHSGSPVVRLSLAALDGGEGVRIAVEDHGVGVPADQRARIFERFHRVDEARSAETGGAGLGLAIVRRIARLHGGDVTLEAVEPSGCRFVVELRR